MAYSTFPWYFQRFTAADGSPLAGGSVEFLAAGSTARKDVYLDQSGTVSSNPMPLDSAGFPEHDYFGGDGEYDVVTRDASGALVRKVLRVSLVGGSCESDTYKVKVDGSDPNPDYLDQKVVSSADIVVVSDGNSLSLLVSDAVKYRVKASASDLYPGFLEQKIASTGTVVLEVVNNKLRARSIAPNIVGVTVDDQDPDYLGEKLEDSDTIIWDITGYEGGGQHVRAKLKATAADDHKFLRSGADLVPGFAGDKIKAGTGITINVTTDEDFGEVMHINANIQSTGKVKVASTDTTADFLGNKLVAGPGMTITPVVSGATTLVLAPVITYLEDVRSQSNRLNVGLDYPNPQNVCSLVLPAGTWEVEGSIASYVVAATDVGSCLVGNIGNSATIDTDGFDQWAQAAMLVGYDTLWSAASSITIPRRRITVATTRTIYLVAQHGVGPFTTCQMWGNLTARKIT